MEKELNILLIEDNPDDALLLRRLFQKEALKAKVKQVDTALDMSEALDTEKWDLIISDYSLPKFSGQEALEIFKARHIDIPFILVSGTVGEDIAVNMMKSGAHDYLMKTNLKRIVPAIIRELNEVEVRKQRKDAVENLKKREEQYRNLVENMNEGLMRIDRNGFILFVNPSLCKMLGYESDELLNKLIWELLDISDEKRAGLEREFINKTDIQGKHETRMIRKDREIIWIEVSVSTIMDDYGNIIGFLGLISDITKNREAEIALKESEEKFRGLAERISDLVLIADNNGLVTFVSPSVRYILGYDQQDLIGKRVNEFITYEQFMKVSNNAEKVFKGETIENLEITLQRKDGTKAILDFIGSPIIKDNKPIGLQVVGRDITARKLAEEAVRKSEVRLSAIINNAKDCIFLKDLSYKYILVNPALCKIFGIKLQDFIGKTDFELFGEEGLREVNLYDSKVINGEIVEYENSGLLNGKRFYFDVIKVPLRDDKGIIIGLCGITRDVTERKMAEENIRKLSRAVEQSPASVIITDIYGNIDYVNPKFEEVSGYTLQEVIGKNPRILKSGLISESIYRTLWDTIAEGKVWSGELHNRRKNGELYWESVSISPVKNENNSITHYLAVKEDITRKKEIEFELKHQMEIAEESSRLKSSILANVSHELRTPMTGILGMSQILSEELQDENLKQFVWKIQKSGERLMTTLNSILDLSEIESNSALINVTNYNIGRSVKILLTQYEKYAIERDLFFKYSVKNKNITALVDEKFMNQSIINLVDNAVKYTDSGGIEIIIDSFEEEGKTYAVFRVKDTGIGIELENKEIIFQEFRQASEGFSRSYEGTGLGLTLVKKMVELMNGRIEVESEPKKGSVFSIIVPGLIMFDKKEIEEELIDVMIEKAQRKSKENNLQILLVEDSHINAEVAMNFLKDFSSVDYASEGTTALKLAGEKKYSLILMDINLGPGMDGVSVCTKIKQLEGYESVPVVAITGYALSGDKDNFLSLGFDFYIAKPFTKQQLIGEVSQIIKEYYSN